MEAPKVESMDDSKTFPPMEDDQDKLVNDCCSCCYDCTETFFDYLFCGLC